MKEEILFMIARCQNRIRGLEKDPDPTAVGQRMAYRRVLEDLKRIWEILQEEEKS